MLPLPLPLDEPPLRQRDRHFQRRRKVLGQFFTPPQLAAWMVEVSLSFLRRREWMLDPACGEGVFLEPALAHGFSGVMGIEVDPSVFAACAARLGSSPHLWLRQANALDLLHELEGRFDLVATNPPFSAKYGRVKEGRYLERFELGKGRRSEAIEVLFLELSVRALREDGVLAIVLPEGLFANLPGNSSPRKVASCSPGRAHPLQRPRFFWPMPAMKRISSGSPCSWKREEGSESRSRACWRTWRPCTISFLLTFVPSFRCAL